MFLATLVIVAFISLQGRKMGRRKGARATPFVIVRAPRAGDTQSLVRAFSKEKSSR